jgi:hypothetical protein
MTGTITETRQPAEFEEREDRMSRTCLGTSAVYLEYAHGNDPPMADRILAKKPGWPSRVH